jgi:hypothetical protein
MGRRDMWLGAMWFVGGIAASVGVSAALSKEDGLLVASGALFWGAMQFLRGLDRWRTGKIRPFWNFRVG